MISSMWSSNSSSMKTSISSIARQYQWSTMVAMVNSIFLIGSSHLTSNSPSIFHFSSSKKNLIRSRYITLLFGFLMSFCGFLYFFYFSHLFLFFLGFSLFIHLSPHFFFVFLCFFIIFPFLFF